MRSALALLPGLLLAGPALGESPPAETGEWVALHDKVVGRLGTNPRNRAGLMLEVAFDVGGKRRFPVIWDADNAGQDVLRGCDFRLDGLGTACRAQAVVSVLKARDIVVIVEHLVALEK